MMRFFIQLDKDIFLTINNFRIEVLDAVMPVLSYPWLLWVLGGAAFFVWVVHVSRRVNIQAGIRLTLFGLALILGTAGVTDQVVHIIKVTTGRVRPQDALPNAWRIKDSGWHRNPEDFTPRKKKGESFVSGHCALSMSVAVTAATLYPPVAPAIYVLPVAVGYSRIYLGKHYPSDVLAGWIVGGGIALLARRLTRARRRALLEGDGASIPNAYVESGAKADNA